MSPASRLAGLTSNPLSRGHCRDTEEEVLSLLEPECSLGGFLHCIQLLEQPDPIALCLS